MCNIKQGKDQNDISDLPVDWGLPEKRCNVEKPQGELDVTSVSQDPGIWYHSGKQKGECGREACRQGTAAQSVPA